MVYCSFNCNYQGELKISKYKKMIDTSVFQGKTAAYFTLGCKLNFSETSTFGRMLQDMGVRNAILGFRQMEETHAMENVVYNELRRRRFQVDVGQVDVWGKDISGKTIKKELEVDFVVNRSSTRIYIQSALVMHDQEKENQEQASLLSINDAFRKVIIIGGYHIPHYNDNGVLIIGLFNFLMDIDSLDRV